MIRVQNLWVEYLVPLNKSKLLIANKRGNLLLYQPHGNQNMIEWNWFDGDILIYSRDDLFSGRFDLSFCLKLDHFSKKPIKTIIKVGQLEIIMKK